MGRIHYCPLLLLLLALLLVSSSSASSQGTDGRISLDEKAVGSSPASLEEDFSTLMGEGVVCEEKDEEECLKRRMVAEAHLDYIYTQSHNHP